MTGFLPPRAPGGKDDVPPPRWEARPKDGDGHARVVVAARPGAPEVVRAGETPPRNGHAIASLGVGLAGLCLLVVSIGLSFLVSGPCAVIALVLGRQGRRRAQAESVGGSRAARAGVVLGVVGIVLCVAAAIAWTLVFALDIDVGTDLGDGGPSAPTEFSVLWRAPSPL